MNVLRTVFLLGLVSFFTDISSEMVYPLIPIYLTSKLGTSPAIIGIIEGIAESLASLLKVFSGYFSDKIDKRKPITIGGYSISSFGKVLLIFSSSWLGVLGGRILDRFGKGIRTAPRDALIAQATSQEKYGRSFGLHKALDSLGAVIGVLISYYLISNYLNNYKVVFILSLIPAYIGILLLFPVKEKNAHKNLSTTTIKFSWSQFDINLKKFLLIIFLFTLGNSSNHFLLLRAQSFGFDSRSIILLYLVYNIFYATLSYPAGSLSDKMGRKKILLLGYLSYGLIYLGFAFANRTIYFWLLFALYGFYAAFTAGIEKAYIADIAPTNQRGTLLGLYATMKGIGLLPASILAGFLWNYLGPKTPFIFGSSLSLLATLGLTLVMREEQ